MKVFTNNDMPAEVHTAWLKYNQGYCNDVYLKFDWLDEDDEDYMIVVNWLESRGCRYPEDVLLEYMW